MQLSTSKILTVSLVCALTFVLQSPLLATSQDHVVSTWELQQATASVARSRQQNIDKVEKFFSTEQAEKALNSAHLNAVQVRKAVPTLSDQELARLASRAEKADKDFAAGALTNQQITYILIALATAIIVLIAVH